MIVRETNLFNKKYKNQKHKRFKYAVGYWCKNYTHFEVTCLCDQEPKAHIIAFQLNNATYNNKFNTAFSVQKLDYLKLLKEKGELD